MNDMVNNVVRDLGFLPQMQKLFKLLRIILILSLSLTVVIKHYCDCEVENEKRAYHYTWDEIETGQNLNISFRIHIHELGPAFPGNRLENGNKGSWYVIEAGHAPIKVFYHGVSIQVIYCYGSMLIMRLYQGTTVGAGWAFSGATERGVFRVCYPVSINRALC